MSGADEREPTAESPAENPVSTTPRPRNSVPGASDPFSTTLAAATFELDECPPTPASDKPQDLTYVRRPMVGWFTPSELARTGIQVVLSSLFGAYADNREMQAALQRAEAHDYTGETPADGEESSFWLDYIADLGDGWDSTYTMARLLREEKLELRIDADTHSTERGRILVMGGDQVYPTATREEYRDRFVGPYVSSLPWVPPTRKAPHLFALPGNHDWYDGLTSFRRLFCHERWIGGRQTRQKHSYFALALPHDWWLWGVDMQLDSDIDEPQLDFFRALAADPERMPRGSKIVLCVAEPCWVFKETKGPDSYRNLAYFEKDIVLRHGHEIRVGLSGDLHTYARYEEEGGARQRFICGGGGAYLYPTHGLPENLDLPDAHGKTVAHPLRTVFPDTKTSRRLTVGALLFPFKNPRFSTLLGAYYLWLTWLLESASVMRHGEENALLAQLRDAGLDMLKAVGVMLEIPTLLAHAPGAIGLLLLFVAGWIGFADTKKWPVKVLVGGTHAAVHLLVMAISLWAFAVINLDPAFLGLEPVSVRQSLLFAAEMLVVGGAGGGVIMGFYLWLSNLFGLHTNEVFSCQSLTDYKNFLRLRFDPDGGLTIFPIGVRRVLKRSQFRFAAEAKDGAAWFEPLSGKIGEVAELIEQPIHIDP